jgi:uncharacterized membrane protein
MTATVSLPAKKANIWAKIRSHVRSRIVSGILLLMPFGVVLLVMSWLFRWVVSLLQPLLEKFLPVIAEDSFIGSVPQSYTNIFLSLCSIAILLLLVYLVGAIGQLVLVRHLISLGEVLVLKAPVVRTIYTASKQAVEAISLPNRAAFKSVVLVEFPRPGLKTIGFITGHIRNLAGETFFKVFIPASPNLTTGFLEIVPASGVTEIDITIEDGFRIILSGGIVCPEMLDTRKPS